MQGGTAGCVPEVVGDGGGVLNGRAASVTFVGRRTRIRLPTSTRDKKAFYPSRVMWVTSFFLFARTALRRRPPTPKITSRNRALGGHSRRDLHLALNGGPGTGTGSPGIGRGAGLERRRHGPCHRRNGRGYQAQEGNVALGGCLPTSQVGFFPDKAGRKNDGLGLFIHGLSPPR